MVYVEWVGLCAIRVTDCLREGKRERECIEFNQPKTFLMPSVVFLSCGVTSLLLGMYLLWRFFSALHCVIVIVRQCCLLMCVKETTKHIHTFEKHHRSAQKDKLPKL